MSDRGRGADSPEENPENQEPGGERATGRGFVGPPSARPIEPYDPYRTRGTAAPRSSGRASGFQEQPSRRPSRPTGGDPFLPDDDPLNADAWQLELDDVADGDIEPPSDIQPAPRRPRRTAPTSRGERESGAARPGRRARAKAPARAVGPSRLSLGVPRAVAGSPLAADQTALILLGISAVSLLLMVLVLAARLGAVASPTVLHLDAAGSPDRWGAPSVLWRLPLMSFFTTLIFLAVAWFLYPVDRFGARFALAITVLAQLITWVAVIQHVA